MDPPGEHNATVERLRRNPVVLALGLAPLLLGPLALALAGWIDGQLWQVILALCGVLGTMISPFIAIWVVVANPRALRVPTALQAAPTGVSLDGRLVAPRPAILGGFVIPDVTPDGERVVVRIERRLRGPVELLVKSADEGRAVLRALGLDASQVVASFRLRSLARADWRRLIGYLTVLALIVGTSFVMVLSSAATAALFVQLCLLVLVAWAVLMSMPARVSVGTDGVLVSFFWRERFIPYTDILHVGPAFHGVQSVSLVLQSGGVLRLPTRAGWTEEQQRRETLMIVERIQEALEDARRGGLAHDAERLARGERPLTAWIAHLRSLGAGANADHRTAPIPAERLWRLAADPTSAPATRVAAAVALAGGGHDPEARARLRALAAATVAPRLRVALAAAADISRPDLEAEAEAEAEAELAHALELLESREPREPATPASPSTPGSPWDP